MKNLAILTMGLLLFGGLVLTLGLVRQRQQLTNQASVGTNQGGTTQMFLSPETATLATGQELVVRVMVNVGSTVISAITAQLDYEFDGALAPTIESIEGNRTELIPNNNWNYPFMIHEEQAKIIKIAAVNVGTDGYRFNGETMVARVRIKARSAGVMTIKFNSTHSKVIAKDTGADILITPTSIGRYTVTEAGPTTSPAPTATPTLDPTKTALNFSFRFQGVTKKRGDKLVRLAFKPTNGGTVIVREGVQTVANDAGVYAGTVNNVPPGEYQVLLKGGSHLQKRFEGVRLTAGENNVNWSTRQEDQLLVGDVNNTNSVTIEDLAQILVKYTDFKVPVDATRKEDVNFDGFMTLDDAALSLVNYTDFEVMGEN